MMNPFSILISWITNSVEIAPLFSLFMGILLFVTVCLANWVPKYRKVANYYLSGMQKDEKQAYATAEGRIYGLNSVLVPISGMLILFSLILLGIA